MKRLLGLGALLASLAGPGLAEVGRVVTTTGVGMVEAVPDMAILDIGVTGEAASAADALARTSQAMQAVMARLTENGVAARDMQTRGLDIQPLWLRPEQNGDAAPRITGYVARNGMVVRIRDLSALGDVLDLVVADGANTFNGLQFTLQESEAEMAKARAAAVAQAMRKAEELAAAAGVTLGALRSITEGGEASRPVMMEMASARLSDGVPIAPGEVSLTARVTMVFELAE
jgi:uncharacterized protein YggE